MLVISTTGARGLLGQLVPYLDTLQLRLFVNDFTPSRTDSESAFVDASYDGYVHIPLDDWPQPFVNGNDQGETSHPTVTFRVGPGGGTGGAYGYWITDAAGRYLFAERFAFPPVDMSLPGQTCPVTVRLLSGPLC